jgi:hypothetical protein
MPRRNFVDKRELAMPEEKTKRDRYDSFSCVTAAALKRISAHLAVLASLLIIGEGTGHPTVGQLTIFLLIALASLMHTTGRALQRRLAGHLASSRNRT